MKTASLARIRDELQHIPEKELISLCLRIAKYKKENKELLSYLLFEAHNEAAFVNAVKKQMDIEMTALNPDQVYLAKKTIRKVLRTANKNIKFAASKQIEVELLLYFCQNLYGSGLSLRPGTVLYNLLVRQIHRVKVALKTLHEDLQHDFSHEVVALENDMKAHT